MSSSPKFENEKSGFVIKFKNSSPMMAKSVRSGFSMKSKVPSRMVKTSASASPSTKNPSPEKKSVGFSLPPTRRAASQNAIRRERIMETMPSLHRIAEDLVQQGYFKKSQQCLTLRAPQWRRDVTRTFNDFQGPPHPTPVQYHVPEEFRSIAHLFPRVISYSDCELFGFDALSQAADFSICEEDMLVEEDDSGVIDPKTKTKSAPKLRLVVPKQRNPVVNLDSFDDFLIKSSFYTSYPASNVIEENLEGSQENLYLPDFSSSSEVIDPAKPFKAVMDFHGFENYQIDVRMFGRALAIVAKRPADPVLGLNERKVIETYDIPEAVDLAKLRIRRGPYGTMLIAEVNDLPDIETNEIQNVA